MKALDQRLALIFAVAGRLQLIFNDLPKEDTRMRGTVLALASHVLDYSRPETSIIINKPEPTESQLAFLVRCHDRIRVLPQYRWPHLKFPPETLPQMLFGPLQATKQLLAGSILSPQEVLEFTAWLEPVWTVHPTLRSPVTGLVTRLPQNAGEPAAEAA